MYITKKNEIEKKYEEHRHPQRYKEPATTVFDLISIQ